MAGMHVLLQTPFDGGLFESMAQVAVAAGTLVLLLGLVALGATAYKHFRGDGITWPEDMDEDERPVQQGNDEDEWEYY
jgi:hypothetical protein